MGSDPDDLDSRLRVCNLRYTASVARSSGQLREPAKVLHIDVRRAVDAEKLPRRIARMLDNDWQVDEYYGKPTIIISVTGSAQDFKMLPRLQRVFREGLVRAAQITNAWVFTGGSATGVMKHVGDALAAHPDIPLIGVALYGNVVGSELIERELRPLKGRAVHKYRTAEYAYGEDSNDIDGAALEPHHTHLLLVDNGEKGRAAWGGEVAFRAAIERAYCEHEDDLPAVLLVVQGGPNTLLTVLQAVRNQTPVVVVAGSLGAASAIRDFLTRTPKEAGEIARATERVRAAKAKVKAARQDGKRAVRAAKQEVEKAKDALLALEQRLLRTTPEIASKYSRPAVVEQLRQLYARRELIELFELGSDSTTDISLSILSAVARHPTLPEDKLLELAIVWDNEEMIERILARRAAASRGVPRDPSPAAAAGAHPAGLAQQQQSSMRASLQLALETQRADVVTMLLSNGADIAGVMLSRLYMQSEKNRFRIFRKLQSSISAKLYRLEKEEEAELALPPLTERTASDPGRYIRASGRLSTSASFALAAAASRMSSAGKAPAPPATTPPPAGLATPTSDAGGGAGAAGATPPSAGAGAGADAACAADANRSRSGSLGAVGASGGGAASANHSRSGSIGAVVGALGGAGAGFSRSGSLGALGGAGGCAGGCAGGVSSDSIDAPMRRASSGCSAAMGAAAFISAARSASLGRASLLEPSRLSPLSLQPVGVFRERRRMLRAPVSYLKRSDTEAHAAAERWFVREAGEFRRFIEQWLLPEHHGMHFDLADAELHQLEAERATTPQTTPQTSPARRRVTGAMGRALSRGRSAMGGGLGGGAAADAAGGSGGGVRGSPLRARLGSVRPMLCTQLQDVFFWAVLMGEQELATVLWRFSRQHLRLALLAADVCYRMMYNDAQGRKHRDEIEPMREHWLQVSLDVLEQIRPPAKDARTTFAVASDVLEHVVSGQTAIDLAIQLRAKSFIAHRYCQLIMAKRWTGAGRRARTGVRGFGSAASRDGVASLRFVDDTAPNWKIVLKMVLPWGAAQDVANRLGVGWALAQVQDNDYDDDRGEEYGADGPGGAAGAGAAAKKAAAGDAPRKPLGASIFNFSPASSDESGGEEEVAVPVDAAAAAEPPPSAAGASSASAGRGGACSSGGARAVGACAIPPPIFVRQETAHEDDEDEAGAGANRFGGLTPETPPIPPSPARSDTLGPAAFGYSAGAGRYQRTRAAWHQLYSIPVVKFWARTLVTYSGFTLVLGALMVLTEITAPHSLGKWPGAVQLRLELVFGLWVLGMGADWLETRPARRRWLHARAASPSFAYIDTLALVFNSALAVLRALYLALLWRQPAGTALVDWFTGWLFPLMLAGASGATFYRFLGETLMQFHDVGALIICMGEMFQKNILKWLAVMVFVVLGFGFGFTALVPGYDLATSSSELGGDSSLPGADGFRSVGFSGPTGPAFLPIWALFGDFDVARLEAHRPYVPALALVVLMVIMQVLLLNLLIAMMSETYTKVMALALIEWKYEHMLLVDYYETTATSTPPPLNLLFVPARLAVRARELCCGARSAVSPEPEPLLPGSPPASARSSGTSHFEHEYEHQDETRAFHAYVRAKEEEARADVGHRVDEAHVTIKALETKQLEDRENIDERMKGLEAAVRGVAAAVEGLHSHLISAPRSRLRELGTEDISKHDWLLHHKARSEENPAYAGKRSAVPDGRVPWEVEWAGYEPTEWTHPVVLGEPEKGKPRPPWADHPDAATVDFRYRRSFEQAIVCNAIGRPLNPRGRTGISGRGLLGKWGPNHAADPIVLRRRPGPRAGLSARPAVLRPVYQMVAIQRGDGGKWAIPGGMVDDGEHVSETLRREFSEEASAVEDEALKDELEDRLDEVFASGGEPVYEGYVDDPRNTDNAWMETTVRLFVIDDDLAAQLTLQGGSDAMAAKWLDLEEHVLAEDSALLYADHRKFVIMALDIGRKRLGLE